MSLKIAYEDEVNILPLLQAARDSLENGNEPQWGKLLKDELKTSKKRCQDACLLTKKAIEDKTTTQGHPWFGKKIRWLPIQTRGKTRDGKLIIEVSQDYDVLP